MPLSSTKNVDSGSRSTPQQRVPSDTPVVPDYELLRLIGSGAYGEVWLARSVTGAFRAVKIVHRGRFEDQRPFEREFAGILKFEPISRLHSSQVAVLHVGRNAEYFYYVMELADDANASVTAECGHPTAGRRGDNDSISSATHCSVILPETYEPRTLKSELKKRGRLSPDEGLRVALSLTTALEQLHQHGLIHRDIKPSNIIFVGGIPKLADIGLVARVDATLSFVGTEGFVPPEGPGSVQADIYSLGKVFYEMCTGRDRQEFPELPTELRAEAGREAIVEMNEIILKACDHDPRKRYQSTEEMHADLALLHAGKSVRRARGIEKRLRRLTHFGMGLAGLAALITAAWFYQQRQTREARFWAEQSRQRLVRLHTSQAIQKMEEGDLPAALPGLVEALKLVPEAQAAEVHRFRLGGVLRQVVPITAFWHSPHATDQIEISPDRSVIAAARGREVSLAKWQAAELGTKLLPHTQRILSAAFGGNGDQLATSTEAGEAIVWDVHTGTQRCVVNQPGLILKFASISPDGRQLATAGYPVTSNRSFARVWNIASGEAVTPVLEMEGAIRTFQFSPDSRYIASVCDVSFAHDVQAWEVPTGRRAVAPQRYAGVFPTILFSPDSHMLCIGNVAGGIPAVDLVSGQVRPFLPTERDSSQLLFSNKGDLLALTGSAGTVYVYNWRAGKSVGAPMNHRSRVRSLAFSPDDRYLLTASDDRAVRLWHLRSGQLARPPMPHESKLQSVAFCREGRGIVTVAEQTVRLWDLSATAEQLRMLVHEEHETMQSVQWIPNGQQVVSLSDRSAKVWDVPGWHKRGFALEHRDSLKALSLSADDQLVATAGWDKMARIWKFATGEAVGAPLVHSGVVDQVSFHPVDRKLLTASGSSVRLWNAMTGEPSGASLEVPGRVTTLAWRPAGGICAVASEPHGGESKLLLVQTAPSLKVVESQSWPGKILRILPRRDRFLVAIGLSDSSVRLWDSATRLPLTPPLKHESSVVSFAANTRQTRGASVTADQVVRLWDLSSGELISPRLGLANEIVTAEFSPDDRFLVTVGGGGRVRIWDLALEGRSVEELTWLSALLAAQEIDSTGATVLVRPDRLAQIWRQLENSSALPKTSAQAAAAWHRREADDCDAMSWRDIVAEREAALFHRLAVTTLEPGSAQDLFHRAAAFAEVNQWDKARADYQRAIALGIRPDPTEPDQVRLQIVTGDIAGYQESCRQLLRRYGDTLNPNLANDVVWTCCLLPGALSNYEVPVRLMRQAAAQRPTQNNIFNTFGAVLFRAGQYQEAVQMLLRGTNFFPGEGSPFDLVFLAMAHQALGNAQPARSFLEKAIRAMDLPEPTRKWKWEVELSLLRNEAERMIQPAANPPNSEGQ